MKKKNKKKHERWKDLNTTINWKRKTLINTTISIGSSVEMEDFGKKNTITIRSFVRNGRHF